MATRASRNGSPKAKKSEAATKAKKADVQAVPRRILAIDIGGTNVKFLASGETDPRKTPSGKRMTPAKMVEVVQELAKDWEYEAVSIGYPGQVGSHGPRSEPGNLGPGWVGFDFPLAFGKPVRIINDAAMQALGSYEGGRMLFLGFGTGLGSALIADKVIVPLELGCLIYKDRMLGELLGRAGFEKVGKAAWRELVKEVTTFLHNAFIVEYLVLGGGNSRHIKKLPPGSRLGHNLTAFRGGFRLWNVEDIPTLPVDGAAPGPAPAPVDWRLI